MKRAPIAAFAMLWATLAAAAPVEGQVVDERGAPVPGAWIILYPPGTPEATLAEPRPRSFRTGPTTAITDAQGKFSLADVPAGRWVARALEPSKTQYLTERDARVEVEVPAGHSAAFRIAFTPGLTLRGRVVGPDGQGVAGATIGAVWEPTEAESDWLQKDQEAAIGAAIQNPGQREMMLRSMRLQQKAVAMMMKGRPPKTFEQYQVEARAVPLATTGPDGRFEVVRLKPVVHAWVAFKTGFTQREVVTARPPGEVLLHLTKSGSLVGRVLDAAGKPALSFEVVRRDKDSGTFRDGAFEFAVDADAEWVLRISTFGAPPQIRKVKVFKDQVVRLPDVTLTAGHSVTVRLTGLASADEMMCQARLRVADGYRDEPAQIDGRVKDAVALFEAVPALPGRLRLWCPGYVAVEREVPVSPGPLVATLERGVVVAGRLVDELGAPWPAVSLTLTQKVSDESTTQYATTDAAGNFRLSGLVGGPAELTFGPPSQHQVPNGPTPRPKDPLVPQPRPLLLPDKGEVRLDGKFVTRPPD